MTTTVDPRHPEYLDEADVRGEMTRVFDVCRACRQCESHCVSFPTLFDMLDTRASDSDQVGAGWLTPSQQDDVVHGCFQCNLCTVDCPHAEDHEIDFARLMTRATAMQREQGLRSTRSKAVAEVLCRTTIFGRLGTRLPFVNGLMAAKANSWRRRLLRRATGLSAERRLPLFAHRTFSAWFAERPTVLLNSRQGRVTLVPTCLVEYQATEIGKDAVRVYERNGIECANSKAGCCGAPWLHSGDIDRFAKIAKKNVKRLADEVRSGTDLVVLQPTCGAVIRRDYIEHVTTPAERSDAELVAEHTFDPAEYLMRLHAADDTVLDIAFDNDRPASIKYHASPQLRLHDAGYSSRDLMWLTGARVALVRGSAGANSVWHLRSEHDPVAIARGEKLAESIDKATGDVVAGDCLIGNSVIAGHSGTKVVHPMQVLARAYGIADEH